MIRQARRSAPVLCFDLGQERLAGSTYDDFKEAGDAMRVQRVRASGRCQRGGVRRGTRVSTARVPRLEAEEDEPERLEDLAEYERIIHHFESAHDAALAAEQYDS